MFSRIAIYEFRKATENAIKKFAGILSFKNTNFQTFLLRCQQCRHHARTTYSWQAVYAPYAKSMLLCMAAALLILI